MKSRPQPDASSQTPRQPAPQGKVTVEDLLRFKRAERPPQEFWAGFEAQLKQRQLAAAIEVRRPWWHALPRLAYALPAGATAAIAIGVIVWRNQDAAQPRATATTAHISPATTLAGAIDAPAATATRNDAILTAATTNQIARTQDTPAANSRESAQHPSAAETQNANAPATGINETGPGAKSGKPTAAQLAATLPVPAEHLQTAREIFDAIAAKPETAPAQSARTFSTVALASAKPAPAKTTSTVSLFDRPITFGEEYPALTIAPAQTTPDDAQTTAHIGETTPAPADATTPADNATERADDPADARRERLLTYIGSTALQNTATPDNPRVIRMRDRVTSRLNDKTLSDSISRIGATGDSLTIKF